jgi:Zn-dependent protease
MVPDDEPQFPEQPRTEPAHVPYSLTPPPGQRRKGWIGGALTALVVVGAKLKLLLGLLWSFKFLFVLKGLLISGGLIFASLFFYAALFGWKFGVVFILLLLVHELGHLVTLRNFGIRASLPYFIPGLGAFVSSPMSEDPVKNATAALMGPVYGVLASSACWIFGMQLHDQFWIACAYTGFFINLFNLVPAYPLDGGRVLGVVDGRLYLLGAALLVAFIVLTRSFSGFSIIILAVVLWQSIPRGIAAFRGVEDPLVQTISRRARIGVLLAYLVVVGAALAGAAATTHQPV